ncbi:hypothetical protein EYF80_016029 [Liparis tanakae]|uniref:Uncharacterized protein n=1 Tax=Liparis tanakae TaxID=230148 RepID=A0A4Z2I6G9_9TELE|nr:hypothetical protein EYF80_016029 [Liparis tanakae]
MMGFVSVPVQCKQRNLVVGRPQSVLEGKPVGFPITGSRQIVRVQVKVACPAIHGDPGTNALAVAEVDHPDGAAECGGSREELDVFELDHLLL